MQPCASLYFINLLNLQIMLQTIQFIITIICISIITTILSTAMSNMVYAINNSKPFIIKKWELLLIEVSITIIVACYTILPILLKT